MRPVPNATGQQVDKKEQIGAKFKNDFHFLKTINFTVINVIRYQLKSIKCSFICHYPMFDWATFQSQWDQQFLS